MQLETEDGGTVHVDPAQVPMQRIGGRGTRVTGKRVARVKPAPITVHQWEEETSDAKQPPQKKPLTLF